MTALLVLGWGLLCGVYSAVILSQATTRPQWIVSSISQLAHPSSVTPMAGIDLGRLPLTVKDKKHEGKATVATRHLGVRLGVSCF